MTSKPRTAQTEHAKQVKYAGHRLVIAKMLIEVMRLLTSTYFEVDTFGSMADEVLLCIAVFIGQAEGRPFNAYKLASFVGVPRASVIRKMKQLEKRGAVQRKSSGVYVLPIDALNSREVINTLAPVIQCIVDTGRQLSKMDSVQVVKRPSE